MPEHLAKRVDGKIAVVTGGSQGMGAAHVRLLAEHGARVVIADVADEQGHDLARELGDQALFVHLDVTAPEQWKHLTEKVHSHFGSINVLINNAGILLTHTIETAQTMPSTAGTQSRDPACLARRIQLFRKQTEQVHGS